MNRYLLSYDRRLNEEYAPVKPITERHSAWIKVAKELEQGLNDGKGYELSSIRDRMNTRIENREVKKKFMNHFDNNIAFSYPQSAKKSLLVYSRDTVPVLAETTIGQ